MSATNADGAMKNREKDSTQELIRKSTSLGIFVFIGVYAVYISYFFFHGMRVLPDAALWGQFGDFVGGVLNPFIAFLALLWITRALKIQSDEFDKTRTVMMQNNGYLTQQTHLTRKQIRLSVAEINLQVINLELSNLYSERLLVLERGATQPGGIEFAYTTATGKPRFRAEVLQSFMENIRVIKIRQLDMLTEIEGLKSRSKVEVAVDDLWDNAKPDATS